ncbi:MAG: HEAT repeat domain-containing protein, partial [Mucilaginibacter sp.]
MKKIFIPFIFLLSITLAKAQTDSRISAILDKEPANNATELNANADATLALGPQGIEHMLAMLQPNGAGDNTKIYDAISGLSFYTTKTGKEVPRIMVTVAYLEALVKATDPYNQAFIISQLQIVSKNDADELLKKYLGDKRLCDPAARALVKMGTLAAKAALRQALPASKDSCRITIVEALGDSRDALAVKGINAVIGQDKKINKVALYALAQIASPVSINLLANAAQNVGLTYDVTNATSSYLLYIRNLGKKDAVTAVRLAKTMISKAGLANQVQTETAALKIIVDIQGAKSMPMLLEAARNNDPKYRAAALKFAGPYLSVTTDAQWIKELNKADAPEKAAIITMLGNNHVQATLPSVLKGLKNDDKTVVLASIKASQQIGQDKALNDLLVLIKTGDTDEIYAIQNALLVMKGTSV